MTFSLKLIGTPINGVKIYDAEIEEERICAWCSRKVIILSSRDLAEVYCSQHCMNQSLGAIIDAYDEATLKNIYQDIFKGVPLSIFTARNKIREHYLKMNQEKIGVIPR
jgi:hypothetical protein